MRRRRPYTFTVRLSEAECDMFDFVATRERQKGADLFRQWLERAHKEAMTPLERGWALRGRPPGA